MEFWLGFAIGAILVLSIAAIIITCFGGRVAQWDDGEGR